MIFLINMNLSPRWCNVLKSAGIEACHRSDKGKYNAADAEIFNFAIDHDYTIITCDMDFTTILAHTGAEKPSVVLLRAKILLLNIFHQRLSLQ